MQTSKAGKDLIKKFEGCKLKAYKCPAGIWTIGYGHTGPDVYAGLEITQTQADALLDRDCEKFEKAIARLVKVPLKQPQYDALISFTFNLGEGNLGSSTLLKMLNAGDYNGAADQFPRWNKAAGKVMDGLTKRRNEERALFLS